MFKYNFTVRFRDKTIKKCRLRSGGGWGFSGASRGISVGHISPEAAEGGPLALIENGDTIMVDLLNRTINAEISEDALEKRRQSLPEFETNNQASKGGVMSI